MNGWKNWETWNAHLWLTSDEDLYAAWQWHGSRGESFTALARWLKSTGRLKTGDGLSFSNSRISRRELTRAMAEEK